MKRGVLPWLEKECPLGPPPGEDRLADGLEEKDERELDERELEERELEERKEPEDERERLEWELEL